MQFFILFIVAMVISAIGFKKYIWFISIGYGFSVAGLAVAMLIMFRQNLTPVTVITSILLLIYGMRLGGYLTLRERSVNYHNTVKDDMVDGTNINIAAKIATWIACALLYCCQVAPVFFRLKNGASDDLTSYIGMVIMASGIILESVADFTKSRYKKKN